MTAGQRDTAVITHPIIIGDLREGVGVLSVLRAALAGLGGALRREGDVIFMFPGSVLVTVERSCI